jgi:hypothetical protein
MKIERGGTYWGSVDETIQSFVSGKTRNIGKSRGEGTYESETNWADGEAMDLTEDDREGEEEEVEKGV